MPDRTRTTSSRRSQRPTRNPRRRSLGLGGFVGLILLLLTGVTFFVRQSQVRRFEKRIEALQQEIKYYTQANENLREQINVLRSDQYIEKVAREKLGLVKPGEIQYILADPDRENTIEK